MYELPPLTETARKILKCCVYDLWDTRRDNYAIQPHMIHSYFDEKYPESQQISLVEINDCIRYFLEVGLARDGEFNTYKQTASFWLTHTGFYYFELEKAIRKKEIKDRLFNSILFPVVVSVITTAITLLISGLLA